MWEESWLSLGLFMTHFVIRGLPASAMFSSAWEAVWKSCVDDNLVFSESVPAVWAFWDRAVSREAVAQGQSHCLARAGSWVHSLAPPPQKACDIDLE